MPSKGKLLKLEMDSAISMLHKNEKNTTVSDYKARNEVVLLKMRYKKASWLVACKCSKCDLYRQHAGTKN